VLPQLARLTRAVPAAGPDALAVAVYADARDRPVAAKESGFEGVACVDDAARVLDVMCDVWTRTQAPWAKRWAEGLSDFVMWMQEPDGRFLNFIVDWEGSKNRSGITSVPGENFWHARALVGLSHAWLTFGDERTEDAMRRGLEHAVAKPAPPDVRTLHLVTALRLVVAGDRAYLGPTVRSWADELVACRTGDVLLNSPYEREMPHLWAHIHEGVLAWTSTALEDPELLRVAVASAGRVIVPAVTSGFDRPGYSPYDVTSCIWSLDRLAEATSDPAWAALAADARSWFDGRNPAGLPVHDRRRGRVADGVDEDRISENSGAESNVVAAEVLVAETLAQAATLTDPLTSPPVDPGPLS